MSGADARSTWSDAWLHPHFEGETEAEEIGTPPGFHGARIGRFEITSGPRVSGPSADYWRPPQVEKISGKLRDKTYELTAPLERFAYATHDEPDGAVGSLVPRRRAEPADRQCAWVIRGTRVPVSALFHNLEDGAQLSESLEWFLEVTREQARLVLEHASRSLEAA